MKLYPFFILSIAFLFSTHLFSQEIDLIPKVSTYLENNGTMTQYKDAYSQFLNLMEKQFPKSDKNSNGWLYLKQNETKALTTIKDLLVPIYIKHFDATDVDEMYTFYTSDTGEQLVKDRTKLSKTQQTTVDSFFNSRIGFKIKEKQELLSKEIASVSEYWSKDLYQTAVLLLKE